jgi:hypothetical protein
VPVDTKFVVMYVRDGNVIGGPVSAGTDGFPSMYTRGWERDLGHTINSGDEEDLFFVSGGGTIRIDRIGTGTYTVHSSIDAALTHGTVHVNSMEPLAGGHCKVAFWNPTDGIRVLCFARDGSLADSTFFVSFVGAYLIA